MPRHHDSITSPASEDPPDLYRTVARTAGAELRVRRSRFIAMAAPASTPAAAGDIVADAARRFHDARHICHAHRWGPPPRPLEDRNDAGEPSGTAGVPILAAIRKAELSDCVVVVVRYFGGIKLGTGGLARAYGEAAEAALEGAGRRDVLLGRRFRLRFTYPQQKTVDKLVDDHRGRILEQEFAADVSWRIWLPHSRWRGFRRCLVDATADTATFTPEDVPEAGGAPDVS